MIFTFSYFKLVILNYQNLSPNRDITQTNDDPSRDFLAVLKAMIRNRSVTWVMFIIQDGPFICRMRREYEGLDRPRRLSRVPKSSIDEEDPYATTKTMMRVGGGLLILIGAILLLSGLPRFMSMPEIHDPGDPDFGVIDTSDQTSGFIMSGIGMFCVVGGISLLRISFLGRYAHYVVSESRDAVEIVGRTAGRSMARGLRDSGGFKVDISDALPTQTREVVKVKCRQCGYLETEDATFCSKCGSRI